MVKLFHLNKADGKFSSTERGLMKPTKFLGPILAGATGVAVGLAAGLYASRIFTLMSIHQITNSNTPYNLYAMDVKYHYSLDCIIERGLNGDQKAIDSLLHEAFPLLPVHLQAPNFGCSAFTLCRDGKTCMGRNYDFKLDTSAMMVHCAPKDGYESIGFAALDNVNANDALANAKTKMACLAAPFVCLDGINEKGVSIAVLTLDSAPTRQNTGKQTIATPLAIRLVLDRAANTQEAVDLLQRYDMFATSGRDYHFYITDASGDGRVVEFDCDSDTRETVVTPTRQVTNFFVCHEEKVKPNQKNGHYGHGRERFESICKVLDTATEDEDLEAIAWEALRSAAQEPNPEDVTSNTQWSVVFDNANPKASISIRRNFDDVYNFGIEEKKIKAAF